MRLHRCCDSLLGASMLLAFSGCAHQTTLQATPGAADLEARAESHERGAARHEAQYDPAAGQTLVDQSWSSCPEGKACWSNRTNTTEVHRLQAEKLRERADQLRKEAEHLRLVEAEKCAAYDPSERDVSPFFRAEDIQGIEPVWRTERRGTAEMTQLAGARVIMSAEPGVTESWLQGLIDCHMARAAVEGFDADSATGNPLSVPGATAKVVRDHGAFSVRVEAQDEEQAREVWRRMSGLQREVAKSAQR